MPREKITMIETHHETNEHFTKEIETYENTPIILRLIVNMVSLNAVSGSIPKLDKVLLV